MDGRPAARSSVFMDGLFAFDERRVICDPLVGLSNIRDQLGKTQIYDPAKP